MILPLALLLDAALGEPDWLYRRVPHPAVLLGKTIHTLENRLNHGENRLLKGVLAVALLVASALICGWLIALVPDFGLLEVIVAAMLLAQRSLVEHVRAVSMALQDGGTPAGRAAVAQIVGRDTSNMDGPAIARAAIESGAENLSDGVVAPALWFAVGGLPAMLAYKAVNTADSMIGHRNERYRAFGWAAARLDDLLNWIPARVTAVLLILTSAGWMHWHRVPADARHHASPNAGWPEAAIAPILDVSLGGPRSYDGNILNAPWIHPEGRKDLGAADIARACTILWRGWFGLVLLAIILAML
ncbi:MAG: adenosylcobinamide-phosphate synthase CbiB [Pseudomonadota bacterium]